MLNQVKNLIRAFHIPSREERERAYLEGSSNAVDLEFRQREIDAGRFREGASYY